MDFSWQIGANIPPAPPAAPPSPALRQAQAVCARITQAHSRSFSLGARLLPPEKRRAVHALYAFCRVSDDLVDSPAALADPAAAARALEAWRGYVLGPADATLPGGWAGGGQPANSPFPCAAIAGEGGQAVALAFTDALRRYAIPPAHAHALVDGVARDLRPQAIHTYAQLAEYAYGVAATVGLMSMHIIGYREPAPRYAAQLGQALQIVNILRDVGADLDAGRLYLPRVELAAFGVRCGPSDETLDARELIDCAFGGGEVSNRWRAFMAFQVRRARALVGGALPGLALLHPDGRLAVALAALLYRAILDDIAAHDYDVFTRRAHAGTGARVRALAGAAALCVRHSLRAGHGGNAHMPTRPRAHTPTRPEPKAPCGHTHTLHR